MSEAGWSVADYEYMAEAIRLAKRGVYTTDPNPRVGCVLVKDQCIIGRGYHVRAGEGHAEVNALREAGENARGATAYVTLEPCSHFGRTPPCAEALIKAGVTRVVSAMQDPNPTVAGNGLAMLSAAGIKSQSGLLAEQAKALNPGFIKRMESGKPYVRLKMAMSLDGRTAMQSGESQWITGAAARADVQKIRARSSAIITGIGSILIDDSALTVRDQSLVDDNGNIRQPLRVVLDSTGRLSETASILKQPGRTLWVTQYEQTLAGCERIDAKITDGRVDLVWLLEYLAKAEQCNEVLVEAGAELAGAFLQSGLVDELVVYMAPTLLGSDARPLVVMPITSMIEQQRLLLTDVRQLGDDIRMSYRFAN